MKHLSMSREKGKAFFPYRRPLFRVPLDLQHEYEQHGADRREDQQGCVLDALVTERRGQRVAQVRHPVSPWRQTVAARHDIADAFTQRFVERMKALAVGDPMQPDTDIGPLATRQIVDDLERQVEESVRRGARILTGGKRRPGPGNYFEPTVLANIPTDSPAYRDELFGPVASLFTVRDIDEAIRIANDTTFGLAAAAWTRDDGEASRLARDLEAGTVFINGMVASDPRFPFGGVKNSGYGRELGPWGLREFVNIKTVRRPHTPASAHTE